MDFEVISDITGTETVATVPVFVNVLVFASDMGQAGGESARVSRNSDSYQAKLFEPSYTSTKQRVLANANSRSNHSFKAA
jgi:hypothetical protein